MKKYTYQESLSPDPNMYAATFVLQYMDHAVSVCGPFSHHLSTAPGSLIVALLKIEADQSCMSSLVRLLSESFPAPHQSVV